MLKKRIRSGFTGFLDGFRRFSGSRGGLRRNFMIGIDRAHRARSGTSLGTVLDTKEANPDRFFTNFHVFSAVF